MPKEKILVVDDEPMIRWTLSEALRGWNYEPVEASSVVGALSGFENEHPTAVLLDINLPDGSGLDVLAEIKKLQPQAVVIMITANVLVEDTIAALRGGAYDFIGKPINLNELQITLRNGIEAGRLRKEVHRMRRERSHEFNFDQIIAHSPAMQRMIALARKVAESEASSVLLQGESGTGKDLVAKAIHYSSRRAEAPFVAINCAAIPATLIESELFGFEKGSFTDAKSRKEGLLEQAEGGTIFLDEIGELELSLQAKLLRVLEEGSFRRVGGLKDLPLDVRILAASNRDLKTESEAGRFRIDLYYRLSVIQIDLPPLRERGDDVLLLADYYLQNFNAQFSKNKRPTAGPEHGQLRGLSPEVAHIFRHYAWPGNVRELRNVIERVSILEDGDLVTTNYLPRGLILAETNASAASPNLALPNSAAPNSAAPYQSYAPAPVAAPPLATGELAPPPVATTAPLPSVTQSPESPAPVQPSEPFPLPPSGIQLETVELSFVRQALERSRGNQTRAAELLGISRDQLRYRLKKLEEVPAP